MNTLDDFRVGDEVVIITDKYDHRNSFMALGMKGVVMDFVGPLVRVRTRHGPISYNPEDISPDGGPW